MAGRKQANIPDSYDSLGSYLQLCSNRFCVCHSHSLAPFFGDPGHADGAYRLTSALDFAHQENYSG